MSRFPEPPLTADAHRRKFSGFDQRRNDCPQVDLKIIEYLLGRQKAFVVHAGEALYHDSQSGGEHLDVDEEQELGQMVDGARQAERGRFHSKPWPAP